MTGLTILLILTVQVITTSVGFRLHNFDPPAASGCTIDLAINGKITPLVVTEKGKFLYPRKQSFIKDQKIVISCPGGSFNYPNLTGSALTASCVSGTNFRTQNSVSIDFATLVCIFNNATSPYPRCNVKKVGKSCYLDNRGKLYQTGFKITGVPNSFVPEYTVCFDETAGTPLYTKVNITQNITEKNSDRPYCKCFRDVDNIFRNLQTPIDIETVYAVASKTIETLTNVTSYIVNGNHISRGHLVANADMFYSMQRDATFTYINMAPQWYLFNSKNWASLEEAVKNQIVNIVKSWRVVYTGTLGVTTLGYNGDPQNKQIPLYLYSINKVGKVPMPRWFWKTYDCKMFFFGYNNPWHDEITANDEFTKICAHSTDISTLSGFNSIILHNQTWGFMYACDSSKIIDKELQYFFSKECDQKPIFT